MAKYEKLPEGGFMATVSGVESLLLIRMKIGDSRCAIKKGSRVRKVNSEEGDHTHVHSEGTVTGSLHDEEHGDCYLVRFDGDEMDTFIHDLQLEEL